MSPIHIVVTLIVLVLLLGLLFYVLQAFPIGEPLDKIIRVIAVVVAVLVLIWVILQAFGMGGALRVGYGYGYGYDRNLTEKNVLTSS